MILEGSKRVAVGRETLCPSHIDRNAVTENQASDVTATTSRLIFDHCVVAIANPQSSQMDLSPPIL